MSYFLWSKNALCRMPTFFIRFTLCPGSQVIKGTLGPYCILTTQYKTLQNVFSFMPMAHHLDSIFAFQLWATLV